MPASGPPPEVDAAARAEAIRDVPPVASGPTKARTVRRGPGRPKSTSAPSGAAAGTGGATPPGARGPGRPPGSTKPKLAPKLQELIGVAGLFLSGAGIARGDERLVYDGERILAGAERLALALDRAAQESPALRRTLEMLVATSTWGELVTAAGVIVLPIMANHGALPELAAVVAGAPPPAPRPASKPGDDAEAGDARQPAYAGNGDQGWPPAGRVPLDVFRTFMPDGSIDPDAG